MTFSMQFHIQCLREMFVSGKTMSGCRCFFLHGGTAWTGLGRLRASMSSSAIEKHGGVSLVQGASRGLGFEFVRQLLEENSTGHVVATCRDPQGAENLLAMQKQHHDRLTVAALDVTDEGSIHAAADLIAGEFGRLDLLVNTAGLLHIPGVLHPETSLSKLEPEALIRSFRVNAAGPILVTKHMWPLLKAGGGRNTSRASAVVANLSARVSSISDNQLGGWYSYRASKTALNQLTKCAALEFARRKDPISCILLHPGTVDTDLSKPFQRNVPQGKLFTAEYSVRKLMEIIDRTDAKDNGKFFAWDGHEIPW